MESSSSEHSYQILRGAVVASRGLSSIFWALPAGVVLSTRSAMHHYAAKMEGLAPVVAYAFLFYGLLQLERLPCEKPNGWKRSLWRAAYCGFASIGLAPFVLFWNQHPESALFQFNLIAHGFCVVGFLVFYNLALGRLSSSVITDELQSEVQFLARFNQGTSLGILIVIAGYFGAIEFALSAPWVDILESRYSSIVVTCALMALILPISMTMNLTWKFKDAVFDWYHATAGSGESEALREPEAPRVGRCSAES